MPSNKPPILIDPNVIKNLAKSDKELSGYVADLDDAYAESVQSGQTSIIDAALKAGISDAISTKDLDEALGKFGKAAGAVVGAAVCSSAPALAPVCAAAGSWVGDKLGKVLSDIGSAIGDLIFATPSQSATVGVYNPDAKTLEAKRKAILSAIAQAGDDKEAIGLIQELADKVAPLFPAYTKMQGWKNLKDTPGGLGYATVLAAPPFVVAPKAFVQVEKPSSGELGDLDPNQGPGGYFFVWNQTMGWEGYVVNSLVNPFVLAGLPVQWVKEQAMAEPLPISPESGLTDYWKLTAKVAELLIPEIDKWVQNRIRWILEESALRRNLRATKYLKQTEKRLREIHPSWGKKQVAEAQDKIVRAVQSDDPELLSQVVSKLSAKDAKPEDVTTTKDPKPTDATKDDGKKEPIYDGVDPKYKKEENRKKGNAGMLALAAIVVIYFASKGLG